MLGIGASKLTITATIITYRVNNGKSLHDCGKAEVLKPKRCLTNFVLPAPFSPEKGRLGEPSLILITLWGFRR